MTLQQIHYVLTIARCGSISKAAQVLFIAQPHLSTMLRKLEKELGITIFQRSHEGVFLTADGREFLMYAKPLYEQERRIAELYAHHAVRHRFYFTLATQRYPFVVQAFITFFQHHDADAYELCLQEMSMYQVIQKVYNHHCDMGIINLTRRTRPFLTSYLAAKRLLFHPLADINTCAFFNQDHPLASKEKVTLDDLKPYPYLAFKAETTIPEDFSEEVPIQDFPHAGRRFTVNDRATINNILYHTQAYSIGTGILPETFAGENLTSRPIVGHEKEIQLGWIQRKNEPIDTLSKEFLGYLQDILRQYKP